ncbi:MAG TPA: cysteine desulfurase, partial [Thermoplasmata archaeon]|nr:cysteine desulfurase [Thermoplasmata archaeon]
SDRAIARQMEFESTRKDFPVLAREFDGRPLIYLDNACMTLKPRPVIAAMQDYYEQLGSCAGRSVHKLGVEVTVRVDEVREKVAKFLGAREKSECIYTRNTTEGINLVARGLHLDKGDVVLTTDFEHNSNLAPWHLMRRLRGIEHEAVKSNEDGSFDIENLKEAVSRRRGKVKLLSMVHTSNLNGITIPAREVAEVAHDAGALLMLDAAQSVPHKPVDVRKLGVDFLACSVHKMCGPTGMGLLFVAAEHQPSVEPFIVGGDTVRHATIDDTSFLGAPNKWEAGLQNYAGIIGTGAAIDYLEKIGRPEIAAHETSLNRAITKGLAGLDGISVIGPQDPAARGGIFSFNLEGADPHDIALALDESANIAIRSGTHCVHSFFNARGLRGSARASCYFYNTRSEAERFVEELTRLADAFRKGKRHHARPAPMSGHPEAS